MTIKRRDFITLLGCAVVWPLAARAQHGAKHATIGLLGSGAAARSHLTAAFVQRMAELGWIEGRNLTIEYRWAEGETDRLPRLADELVRLRVDVLLTHNTPPTLAAKRATSAIPIVFAMKGRSVLFGEHDRDYPVCDGSICRVGRVTRTSRAPPRTRGPSALLFSRLALQRQRH